MVKFASSLIALTIFTSLGTPAFAFIYWRNDTEFKFNRNGGSLTKCYYQTVSQVIRCPKGAYITEEPKCPGRMVWLHNANINNKKSLLFNMNWGRWEGTPECRALLKELGSSN